MFTFVLLHEPGPDWKPGVPYPQQPGLEAHVAFIRRLAAVGQLLIGGPFEDEEGGGLLVIRAESLEQATTLANEDESIGRLLQVTVRPWRIAMSTVDLGAATSPNARTPEPEDS